MKKATIKKWSIPDEYTYDKIIKGLTFCEIEPFVFDSEKEKALPYSEHYAGYIEVIDHNNEVHVITKIYTKEKKAFFYSKESKDEIAFLVPIENALYALLYNEE